MSQRCPQVVGNGITETLKIADRSLQLCCSFLDPALKHFICQSQIALMPFFAETKRLFGPLPVQGLGFRGDNPVYQRKKLIQAERLQ
ncbi:MAG: hypothetical protein ACD_75C00611G0001 [uncultured bacterium]|nr:MAG: hypothetical protein ACD_75C00611G0001 [uncultured bacterium]